MNSELKARYKVLGSEKEHTKSETLTETLIEVIVNGDVEPGSKISEPELARKYQVSPLTSISMVILIFTIASSKQAETAS